jgi:hypothetical protein
MISSSATADTAREKSSLEVWPATTSTVSVSERYPMVMTRTSRFPGCTLGIRYVPSLAVRLPIWVPTTTTWADAMGAIVRASTTRPITLPVCARALPGTARSSPTTAKRPVGLLNRRLKFMTTPAE